MSSSEGPDYVLGHSEAELRRLEEQARFFGDLTALVFREAGLREGMRVLDVGSGAGDVSLLAAQFVGSTGSVLGVDRSADAVKAANARAQRTGAENVRFVNGDAESLEFDENFDAVVGRLVLMYHPEPVEMVRRLAGHLRPDGLLIFHEIDAGHVVAEPQVPLFAEITSWILQTLQASGADPLMGLKLGSVYREAGLRPPKMLITGRAEGGPDSVVYDVFTDLVRNLMPAMERFKIVGPEEIKIDTLAERLRTEVCAGGGVILPPLLVGAWAQPTS